MDKKIPQESEPACMRCGKCCLADMPACASSEDIERWRSEGRKDILHVMETMGAVWAGDHFVSSHDGRYIHACPFLEWEGEWFKCSIYETRPRVCAEYRPGSSEICPRSKK